ncbi:GNAT family N-acetyltransferase [Kushneria phosphatilytica]|uniref:GNAT family N-acetyltransferase n=1 Tax=Kushneria phosphatilytica TaxID=657387 RepID=A0A1S1NUT4_9GAMM|nr:GNAT family N-acetyltransferase [Kushneria phosphatilytica]OHV09945.1 GNAT family N-acetyltransferase [Kushneria phosphatilytica]QEL11620.1 GNAT family N-acetyltransferase [Kushneria phosphatilytica]
MNITIDEGNWHTLGTSCLAIRRRVFIEEQGVSESEEIDGLDPDCMHFLLYMDDAPAGTARLLPDGHIGRVALLPEWRGYGLGLQLMQAVLATATRCGHACCELAAQTHALAFYQRLGFVAHGEEFLDAGLPHYHMRRSLVAEPGGLASDSSR